MLTGLTVSGTTGPERYRFGRVGQRLEKCLAMIEWNNTVVAPVNDIHRTPVASMTSWGPKNEYERLLPMLIFQVKQTIDNKLT